MPRPPAELRKLEEEERRRTRAHRRIHRQGRVRQVAWITLGGLFVLFLILLTIRLGGLGSP